MKASELTWRKSRFKLLGALTVVPIPSTGLGSSLPVPARQMFQCCSDEGSAGRIKDPVRTTACLIQNPCHAKRLHVLSCDLMCLRRTSPSLAHSPAWRFPIFPQWILRQFVRNLLSHLRTSQSRQWFWK